MFGGLADRLRGSVAQNLQHQVATDIDRKIRELIANAVQLWEQNDWLTFDHREANCTVQLYRWCKHIIRDHVEFTLLVVHLEWMDVTPAMLDGTESVITAKRPDLRVEVRDIGRSIECKRLSGVGTFTADYVDKGLARFVETGYGAGEPRGYMVGYVQSGSTTDLTAEINVHICVHAAMGASHQMSVFADHPPLRWNKSSHATTGGTSIDVDHALIDMTQPGSAGG